MITVTMHTGGGMFDDEVCLNFPEVPREGQTIELPLTVVDHAHNTMVRMHGEKDRVMTFQVARVKWTVAHVTSIPQLHIYLTFVSGE